MRNRHGFDETQRATLLRLAAHAITEGLQRGSPVQPAETDLSPALTAARASFVTLEHGGQLRGCIGTLEAKRPLAEDVSHNAYSAAFRDPRFDPVTAAELADLYVSISVLSPPEPLSFVSQADLLAQIEPGVDGLIIEVGAWRRATFLPSVWESLPDPSRFLDALKHKAGLPPGYWSEQLRAWRYTTEIIKATPPVCALQTR